MQDFCPLCMKNGVKKNIKLLQINLQEAIWMCEGEKCAWPFGYEDFIFFPRTVGKVWSCYWDNHKPTASEIKETVVTSTDTTLCDTTVIFCQDKLKGSDNIPSLNPKNSEWSQKKGSVTLYDNKQNQHNINDKHVKSVVTMLENQTDLDSQNSQNANNSRGVPKITSIEKTNIDISNVITGSQTPACLDQDKRGLNVNKITKNKGEKIVPSLLESTSKKIPEPQSFIDLKLSKDNQENNVLTKVNSDVNITLMEIDALPSITIPFKVPSCTAISKLEISNKQQNNSNDTVMNNLSDKTLPLTNSKIRNISSNKRNLTRGKQYEKFSFSAIKKKLQVNNDADNNTTNTLTVKLNLKTEGRSNDTASVMEKQICNLQTTENIKSCDSSCNEIIGNSGANCNQINLKHSDNCDQTILSTSAVTSLVNSTIVEGKNLDQANQAIMSLDTSIVNTSENIDTVLEDFLCNDYSVSEDINVDWINSLLS